MDRNILAEVSEECGRIARKLRRVSEAFLDSFRVLRTEALILDDRCLEDKRRAFDVFGEYNTSMEYVFLIGKTLERLGFIVKYFAIFAVKIP